MNSIYLIITLLINIFSSNTTESDIQLENQYIKAGVLKKGNFWFVDKANNIRWDSDFTGWVGLSDGDRTEKIPLENSETEIRKVNQEIKVHFRGINGKHIQDENFEMVVNIRLEEKHIEFEIQTLDSRHALRDVEYPAHFLHVNSDVEDGYIVVPHLQGIMIPSRYDAGFMRYGQNIWENIADIEKWWDFESGNLNMPWFGAVKDKSSVMVYVETSSNCVLHILGNTVVGKDGFSVNARQGQIPGTRMSSMTPIWQASKRNLSYSRKMRIELVPGGYVEMAKRYKEYARASGRYVTLREKIAQDPQYEKIIGAPDIKIYCYTSRKDDPYLRAWSEPILNGYKKVNTSFSQVAEIAGDLEEMGIEKCLIILGGWNRMGYDRELVDVWPPAEPAGGIEGLKKACESVTEKGYLFALHDNYDDYYPDAPTYDEAYILRDQDGSIHLGGVWDGGLCHIICPARRKELVDRNLDLIQSFIPLNGYYLDVLTSTSHYECFDTRHPVTRKDDMSYRYEIIESLRSRGLVFGGERGSDWVVPEAAFFEGLSGGGTGYHRGMSYRTGLTIPLFYLVYHECVVGYWQHGTPYGREDHANHVLLDLLQAQPSSWSIEYEQWKDLKPMIKDTYDLLGPLHKNTAHAAMTDHNILTKDFMVQHSEFSNGTEVWVNFGITTYNGHSQTIPPKGFILKFPDGEIKAGRVARQIDYLTPEEE